MEVLKSDYKVIITSITVLATGEGDLDKSIEDYRLRLNKNGFHFYKNVGDSGTTPKYISENEDHLYELTGGKYGVNFDKIYVSLTLEYSESTETKSRKKLNQEQVDKAVEKYVKSKYVNP